MGLRIRHILSRVAVAVVVTMFLFGIGVLVLWQQTARNGVIIQIYGDWYSASFLAGGGGLAAYINWSERVPPDMPWPTEVHRDTNLVVRPLVGDYRRPQIYPLPLGTRPEVVFYSPTWLPAAFLLAPAATWCMVILHRRRRQHHRRAAGLCIHCGYDLRATSDRCPECGLKAATDGNQPSGGIEFH